MMRARWGPDALFRWCGADFSQKIGPEFWKIPITVAIRLSPLQIQLDPDRNMVRGFFTPPYGAVDLAIQQQVGALRGQQECHLGGLGHDRRPFV